MRNASLLGLLASFTLSLSLAPVACSSSSSSTAPPDAGGIQQPGDDASAQNEDAGIDAGGTGKDAAPEPTSVACTATGAELTVHPCSANLLAAGNVPRGCEPKADGTLHADEWSDAACFDVAADTMAVYVKYAGESVYIATIGEPNCGCGMPFFFDPAPTGAFGGDEFAISLFDDPFKTDGDRTDYTRQGTAFKAGTAPSGIVTLCKGNQPQPIAYEWKIPFAALGITAGSAHDFGFAISHNGTRKWPATLTLAADGFADNPATWGVLKSASWK